MKRILAILCAMACLFALAAPAMAANNITVTAYVPTDWTVANVYVWNTDTDKPADWPGIAMTKVADGHFTAEIPSGYSYIIVNNKQGEQGVQSADLPMNGTANVWVVFDGTNGAAYDSDPGMGTTPPDAPSTNTGDITSMSIAGTGIPGVSDWNPGDSNAKMTANGSVYSITLGMNANTSIEFKVCANGGWDTCFGGPAVGTVVTDATPIELAKPGENLSYTAAEDSNVTFAFDVSTNTLTVTAVAGTPIIPEGGNEGGNQGGSTGTGDLSGLEYLCLVGEGLDTLTWEPGSAAKMDGKDGVYTIELDLGDSNTTISFKFCGNGDWNAGYDIGGAAEDPLTNGNTAGLATGGKNLTYTGAGKITVTADLNANTVKVTGGSAPSAPSEETTQPTTAEQNDNQKEKKDNTVLFIILGIVAVIAAGTAVAVVLILKKK